MSETKKKDSRVTLRKIQNRLMDTKNIRFGDPDDCAVTRIPCPALSIETQIRGVAIFRVR